MQDCPSSAQLLEAACEAFTGALLPEFSGEKRYLALMVANALAIVSRDLRTSTQSLTKERERLQELFALSSSKIANSDALRDEVEALNRELAAEIGAGAFDAPGEARDRVKAHLLETTRAKLRASNPKHLEAEGNGK
jgi:hypothetical protein